MAKAKKPTSKLALAASLLSLGLTLRKEARAVKADKRAQEKHDVFMRKQSK